LRNPIFAKKFIGHVWAHGFEKSDFCQKIYWTRLDTRFEKSDFCQKIGFIGHVWAQVLINPSQVQKIGFIGHVWAHGLINPSQVQKIGFIGHVWAHGLINPSQVQKIGFIGHFLGGLETSAILHSFLMKTGVTKAKQCGPLSD
jgi:hypothetical protein